LKTIAPAALVCLLMAPLSGLKAGEINAKDWTFLPPGKAQPPSDALEAKKASRCLALYGPGYAPITGTDTCIRIGGSVGVSVGTSSSKRNQLIISPSRGTPIGAIRGPGYGTETDATVRVDTHTPTEYGDFGTHVRVTGVRSNGGLAGPDYVRP
jgi:hypothetical protein